MEIKKRETETAKRGRPRKIQNLTPVPSIVDFSNITKLNQLNIDPRMLEAMPTSIDVIDE